MLNNTEYKSQISSPEIVVDNQTVTDANIEARPAANAARFDQVRSLSRSVRRERRYSRNSGFTAGGWRLTSW